MTGEYRILVQTKRLKYELIIRRNITIIRGDSGTGKTTLVNLIGQYEDDAYSSGVQLQCDKECCVLKGKDWKNRLISIKDAIVFIDESNKFISSKEFASEIEKSDNYYVIITREKLSGLPYSVNEIYELKASGKYMMAKQTFNKTYNLYQKYIKNKAELQTNKIIMPELWITEDRKSGNQFFSEVSKTYGFKCITADGKSNVLDTINKNMNKNMLVIVDGAVFGPEIEEVMLKVSISNNIIVYAPESFEWLLLKSNIIRNSRLNSILENPSQYIDSSKYFSWERYFTALIKYMTVGIIGYEYTKSKIASGYLNKHSIEKVLKFMNWIDFSDSNINNKDN